MESHHPMRCSCDAGNTEHGPKPFVTNITREAQKNHNFRTAFWTGCHLQMTLVSIPACGEIGVEIHPDTDQFIRVEAGQALVCMGDCREELDFKRRLSAGDAVFVPSGTWHNVFNAGNCPLKLSSIYAPPQHPRGTIHRTKADAANEKY
ncbi:MAG: cupin domain-containing protein [Oscillospiraceae bacterium]|jgi:mannose-6-phosphate isomerase-like protein (cupin superfamily)